MLFKKQANERRSKKTHAPTSSFFIKSKFFYNKKLFIITPIKSHFYANNQRKALFSEGCAECHADDNDNKR
ncbi:hypothetical protein CIT292_11128 [Citrobacter youngae ATCC 29220]|uniref:Uncharacterized protein n=1 Tax=Citrobacter youngae ATCC 29220 TaxID=500640 RepID=D4BKP8_9ENTR|nr:hypothetical protein CIT292_11128 [Citrobacter youngae ATCC 29220]